MSLTKKFKKVAKKAILKTIKLTPFDRQLKDFLEHRKQQRILASLKQKEALAAQRPTAITVVNLNANDICNSRCIMCNIWEQKQGYEFSPSELQKIFRDPLFSTVKHVGITGGEPTLRDDLPQLFEAIIKAVPDIRGLSTITNCIKEKDVIDRVEKSIAICEKYGKEFSMMISLDGYGEVHDNVRRRKGNFASAMAVYRHFKEKGISIAIGCTISKGNVWDVDELLDFMKEEGMYGRFRVAEFIKRLYNDDKADVIRNFTEDETYHLILFFYKLIFTFEKNETYRRTYKSIINVLSGGERLIGCPYHQDGVVLNSRGELAYCAPKSEVIGNATNDSAITIYNNNLEERNRIRNEECLNCIHDYHAPITYAEKEQEFREANWRKKININSTLNAREIKSISAIRKGKTQILITGWYGTETVGDKAILAGIILQMKEEYGEETHFVVSSLYPLITYRTMEELAIPATVIPVFSSDFVAYTKGSDVVVMGGGPLMDLEELALPLMAFRIAKRLKGIKTVIFGCGIGPLYDQKYIKATKEILQLSDIILLRDKKSIEVAQSWLTKQTTIKLSGDPALYYLTKTFRMLEQPQSNRLTCYLREWTYEYSRDISYEEFVQLKMQMEEGLAQYILNKAKELNVDEIYFDHMHNFVIGNDDRDFSRYFIKKYFQDDNSIPINYNKRLSTVKSIVNSMKSSRHNICMRFHSVVFAHTLGTSFTAFDYTKGGKILNFLKDNNCLDRMVTVSDLSNTPS